MATQYQIYSIKSSKIRSFKIYQGSGTNASTPDNN